MTQRTIVILSFALFACTLVWGVYTLLVYLGMPVHQYVYLTAEQVQTWDVACGTAQTQGVYLCKGAAVIVQYLGSTFRMASPFFPYIIISILVVGAFLLWSGFKTGWFEVRTRWNMLTIILLFMGSVWLLGTTFSLSTLYNWNTPVGYMITDTEGNRVLQPFRRFFEPTEQVYGGAGPQALFELRANFDDLQERGCLSDSGLMTQNGARLFNMKVWCIQWSMVQRVGLQFVMIFWFLFNLLIVGRFFIVSVIRVKTKNTLLLLCLSIGIGALAWVALLWTLGVFTLLKPTLIRILFFGMPFVFFPQSIWWLRKSVERNINVHISWKSVHILLGWLLLTYLAINFLNVVRPFPIGWDDLGSYLNRPRLLASYGYFIPSMSQFQWEYLTSLGFLLFGYDSFPGSTFAMQINWSAGLIGTLVVYAFARYFFGPGRGVLAAILFYFLPMTGHFSFADMKIDNASFLTIALGLFAACVYLFPPKEASEADEPRDIKLLLVAGLLLGFAFAVKLTAVLGIIMVLAFVIGAVGGSIAFTGAIVTGFGILQKFGAINVTEVFKRSLIATSAPNTILAIAVLVIGLGLIAFAIYRNRTLLRSLGVSVGLLVLGMGIASAPWMLNNLAIGRGYNITGYLTAEDKADYLAKAAKNKPGTISTGMMLGAIDTTAPQIFYGQKADVDALGLASTVPVKYLPPELKVDPEHAACKSSARVEELDRYWGFGSGIGHYLTLGWRQVMNTDAFGYYVTLMPALLLFPLLLLLPFFWSKEGRWLRLLFVSTFVFFVQWSFAANGVPWYGIGMFLGLVVCLEAFIVYAPDNPNRWLMSFLLTMSILICLTNRLWQFDSQKNLFEYPLGKISATALREVTIPDYDDIRESVVSRHETMPETPYTYRIGTFISYFIPRNREIFPMADHQMNFFNCINQEQNHALTLQRLQVLGFNSIIFDTNTQTIEKDPNGSLHQKVAKFMAFANDPTLDLELKVYDPGNGIAYIVLPTGSGSVAQ